VLQVGTRKVHDDSRKGCEGGWGNMITKRTRENRRGPWGGISLGDWLV